MADARVSVLIDTWAAARAALMDYVTTAGTVAQQVFSAIGSISSSIAQGISQSISGLIDGTMSWGEALRNVGSTIVNPVVTAFADMAAQWVVKRTLMFILGRKLDAMEVASNVGKNAAIVASEATTAATTAVASTPSRTCQAQWARIRSMTSAGLTWGRLHQRRKRLLAPGTEAPAEAVA